MHISFITKLRRHLPAAIGLSIIIFAVGVAVFAYSLAPDSTRDADQQIPELASLSPGHSVSLLKIRKKPAVSVNFFQRLLFGTADEFSFVPLVSWKVQGDSLDCLVFNHNRPPLHKSFLLAAIPFALASGSQSLTVDKNSFSIATADGQHLVISREELTNIVFHKHVNKRTYWLGTDRMGRCVLSRLIIGTRITLVVGFVAVLISLLIGIVLGAIAGYYSSWPDRIVMFVANMFWSVPAVLFVLTLILALGRGVATVFIAVGLTMWVDVARMVRGQVMTLRKAPFVEAGQALGLSEGRLLFRHILPNIIAPVMIIAAANFSTAILMEAGLSYLGMGVSPPTPSWGAMLNENRSFLTTDKAYLAFLPGGCILIIVLAFHLLANGLRDMLRE